MLVMLKLASLNAPVTFLTLSSFLWLVATVLGSADSEYFPNYREFYWSVLHLIFYNLEMFFE
jgi:hypothetical protein